MFNKSVNFAHMIELAQHIEVLLLENDCVIVPSFGGFVSHYAPAIRVEEENLFFPPTRKIGFNPQLKLNDGILVQSYMAVHDTNFSDATKMVEKEVAELISTLHEEGKINLENIGEIRYTIHDTYDFIPYDNKITTPYLYGLDSFEMKELKVLQQPKESVLVPIATEKEKSTYEIRINRTYLRNVVATIAAIILFFSFSTPIENTYVEKENYAQLLPTDLFERIEKKSVVMTPIVMKQSAKKGTDTYKSAETIKSQSASRKQITVKEIKVSRQSEANPATALVSSSIITPVQMDPKKQEEGKFHLIVAGGISMKDAEVMTAQLVNKGFSTAKTLSSEGKVRVSILSCTTREEATKQLLKLRENETYKNAWMLAK